MDFGDDGDSYMEHWVNEYWDFNDMNKTIRVLVVDDSVLARTMITQGLAKSPRIEIVGTAFNAVDALLLRFSEWLIMKYPPGTRAS